MKKILLDTNFLIDLIRFKLNLEEIGELIDGPYQLIVLNPVIKELKKISSFKTKESTHAKVVLELLKSRGIEILDTKEKDADKAVLALKDENTIVATNDVELRKKLKSLGTKTIYLRSKKHLAMS
jgi:rRNA-processing protein FCF1